MGESDAPLRMLHVLVIEEHEDLRETLIACFEVHGARVSALSMSEVPRLLASDAPHVAVISTDTGYPDDAITSFRRCVVATGRDPHHVPIVSLRAWPREQGDSVDSVDVALVKPASIRQLVEAVLTAAYRKRAAAGSA